VLELRLLACSMQHAIADFAALQNGADAEEVGPSLTWVEGLGKALNGGKLVVG